MTFDYNNLFIGQLVRLTGSQPDDALAFTRWTHDAEYMRHIDSDMARPFGADTMSRRMAEDDSPAARAVSFRVRTLVDDKLIGFVAIHSIEWNHQTALLAIGIGEPDYRGRGYGEDAMKLTLRYAFYELNLYRVGLSVHSNNERAVRLYEKLGFQREGVIRGWLNRDGHRHDLIWMGLLRDEWLTLL